MTFFGQHKDLLIIPDTHQSAALQHAWMAGYIDYSALVMQCIVSTTVATTENISCMTDSTQLHVEPADHQIKHNACTREKGYVCKSHYAQHRSVF